MALLLEERLFEFCKTFVYEFEATLKAYQTILDHNTEKGGIIADILWPLLGSAEGVSAKIIASFVAGLVSTLFIIIILMTYNDFKIILENFYFIFITFRKVELVI